MKHVITALFFAALTTVAAAQDRRGGRDKPGDFDFYVLSLSWSPTFCAAQSGGRNDQQCGTNKDFRFIVHGLWPQRERGYPADCDTAGQDRVPSELGRQLFDIVPSMGLIGHEWRKHGSCSGLSQRAYFSRLREAFQKIQQPADLVGGKAAVTASPDEIEQKFVAANPGLTRRGITTSCEKGRLSEVRICFTKTLQFRDCMQVDRNSCSASSVTLPPVR